MGHGHSSSCCCYIFRQPALPGRSDPRSVLIFNFLFTQLISSTAPFPGAAACCGHSFLWHDYETFGAVPRRDRPAQFAAIRTDADLNEIGDELMLYCQPAPDFLPDPQACLITGITPQTVWNKAFRNTNSRGKSKPHSRNPAPSASATTPYASMMKSPVFILAQSDRSVCARMAKQLQPLGYSRCRTHRAGTAP
jgi:hypothetical protein